MKKLILALALISIVSISVYAIGLEGERCDQNHPCANGLICLYYWGSYGVCVPDGAIGGYGCFLNGIYMWSCQISPVNYCDCVTTPIYGYTRAI